MLTITKKGDYGLLFLTAISNKDPKEYVSLRTIAKENDLPYKFLSQIAIELKHGKILESKEGLGGGYKLARPTKDISVGEVLDILEGPIAPVSCMRGKPCSHKDHCRHMFIMKKLSLVVEETLNQYTLADLTDK